jgi:N-acetyl-anhydromuramyl-L-alanine amidase AmpD
LINRETAAGCLYTEDAMLTTKIEFPECEYIREKTAKQMIVLHHTVSSTGAYVDDWWKSDNGKSRVAVAYIVEKTGEIYQLFDPCYWAYHIGKGSTHDDNMHSIGIEIVNEGPLIEKNGEFFWNDCKKRYDGEVYTHSCIWRGYQHFACYTEAQYKAVSELVLQLCTEFNIPRKLITSYLFAKKYFEHRGIVSHHNLRSDKTDVSVAFDYSKIKNMF